MKIAYIATSSIPSSTANSIQVVKVCEALNNTGHEPHLIIPGRGEIDWSTFTHQYGVSNQFAIHRVPSRKHFKRFDFMVGALMKAQQLHVDLVYTRLPWVAVLAQIRLMPVILELHDLPAGKFGKPLFKRYIHSRSKKLTVLITRGLQTVIEKRYKIQILDKDLIISPDGVDDERYLDLPDARTARRELGLKEGLTAVYSGGFYKGRGLELLLELAKVNPKCQFLWVGGKSEAVKEWQSIIDGLKLENIKLTGFIPNSLLPLYQAAADILLMPFGKVVAGSSGGNTAEVCSPLKMFEYMAAGRAILTSDLPVLREVLNETNAFFYAIEDFNDLKLKFSQLTTDAGLRERLARQAKIDVSQYSWKKRMEKIIKAFEESR